MKSEEVSSSMALQDLIRAYGDNSHDINNGLCDYFASDLILSLTIIDKAAECLATPDETDLPGHYWVKVDGRYYDAETLFGVPDWRELPIFQKVSER